MRSLLILSASFFFAVTGCAAEATTDSSAGAASAETAASAAAKPSAPVTAPEQIDVILESNGNTRTRVYVPVTVNGQAEHVILDSGTARTWFRLADASSQEFTPNAFVGTIGDSTLSIFGRHVPSLGETVNGRDVIGTIGIDWLAAGPTVLDLGKGTLTRYPVGFEVAGADTWSTLPIQVTLGLMHTHVTVDGIDHQVMIDTGSPTTLLIADPKPGDTSRTAHDAQGNPFTVYDGQGDLALTSGATTTSVRVTRAPVFPHLTDIAHAVGLPIDGLLGLSSMGTGRVLFDLAAGVVRIEPSR